MSVKRLFTLILIGAALLTAHRTFGSPNALEAELGETVSEVTHVAQMRAAIGRAGAYVVAPIVRSITTDTERLIRELKPAMERAPARDVRRARKLKDMIARLDSAAHVSLDEGRPIDALRQAGDGRGLVASVRQVLAEENAFR
jgi:hypothetical protein